MADSEAKVNSKKKNYEDFVFGDELGQGSYSIVYLATDKTTQKQYAIKVLDKKHIIREKKVKYVTVEKTVLNKLSHPLVVRLSYTFQDDSSLYFVLDYAKNGELLDFIKKNSSFDENCTRFYAAEIILAIEYLHGENVIHRDLKPENILLDENMHVKLTDFGTAKILENTQADGTTNDRANSFVGTAEYVSPELLMDKSACKASDLWALGCIVYQLLAGRPPFKGANEYQTFQKITKMEYKFPDGFPPLAKDLVEKLLVLDPAKRLGAGENGFAALKAHPFFEGLEWSKIVDQTPPKILPYLPPISANQEALRSDIQVSKNGAEFVGDFAEDNEHHREDKDHSKWHQFLLAHETIVMMSLVDKRKGLFAKRRQLILTDHPRLIYIDEEKMIQKGEIPWSDALKPELKTKRNFFVHTPNRTYYLEDLNSNAKQWVDQISKILTDPNRKK